MQRQVPRIGGDKMGMFDKYEKWLNAVERLLADGNPRNNDDLRLKVTTKRGRKMRYGIPNKASVDIILARDDRFVYKGEGLWGLAV